jgi:hypothetical protein
MRLTRLVRLCLLLLVLAAATFTYSAMTFARFAEDYTGSDSALVARWNFSARGQDDGEFYNKGFTFDLFDGQTVKPMDHGGKYFIFTGGGSDTAIDYDVRMNTADLGFLTTYGITAAAQADIYAPFIFKITAEIPGGGHYVFMPGGSVDGWFRPKDILDGTAGVDVDQEGYFSILSGLFPVGSDDQVRVTVDWQWNTAFYIRDIDDYADVQPNTAYDVDTACMLYYRAAYDAYYGPGGLQDQRNAAARDVGAFLAEHGGPSPDGTWLHFYPNVASVVFGADHEAEDDACPEEPHEIPCPLNENDGHFAEYNRLAGIENAAIRACETSLLKAYDGYDTAAMNALVNKESVKVMFRIAGNQVRPEGSP